MVCAYGLKAQTIEEKIAECEKYWDPEVLSRANTAKDADYLNDICKQSIYFANLARIDGPLFKQTFLEVFKNDWHTSGSDDVDWTTLREALDKTKGLEVLTPDPQLTRASQSHADDKKKQSHTSGDGTGAADRVRGKFGCFYYGGENMAWGHYQNGLQAILQWLVDAKHYPGYGHRGALLAKDLIYVGVGLGKETDGYDVMVHDFGRWHYETPELLDFVKKSFPSKLIKAADVARNVNYLSDNEKNIIMFANLARISPKMYYTKMYDEFVPWYVGKDTAFCNGFTSYDGQKVALLYPDKKMQKQLCDNVINEGHKPEAPYNIDGETRNGNYNRYIYTFDYMNIIKGSYQMWLDPKNYALAIKFLTTKDGEPGVFVRILHSVSSDNFPNQDKIVTLEDVMGSNYDYNEDVNPQLPTPIQPPSPSIVVPSQIFIDAVYDDGSDYSDSDAPNIDVKQEEDNEDAYYDDDEAYDDDDEDEYDDEDDDHYHHRPGYHHHHHHHYHNY